ncbi:unnamed protein product [Kuraishia capsulata CBS 1993]|uniref:Major facilitator superfamily (MFS) profile domain-containing protein n=1 Tax=Kuraishia capsulata CBS 1993 TaxID=1382522 RepID=W6MVP3_9ASCO|nr:uncharacterized protein KUCA_T00002377001 [Kuraishia capsulata CBS 1993]CDK26405.1 unnamed protein product [Kuraishia capsulata CBS 1993]
MPLPTFRFPRRSKSVSAPIKWIPHYRSVDEEEIKEEVLSTSGLETKEEPVVVREFRDEANKSWWAYFDEYEYRETKEEAKSHRFWYWFEPGTSAAEKKLICKLDFILAFYAFMGYWIKFIDTANLNNAYVSGMKEDLGMKGNDLINTQVLFTVGQIIFELPWIYLMPRVSVTYAVFGCEMIWSLFTLVIYRAESPAALKGFRFVVGSAEAIFFPAVHYMLSSWYKPTEISRRGGFFYMGQFLGVLTSGLLQSAAFRNLNGVNGLPGWKWMFIIDGCISFGVALLGLVLIPGTPTKCYSLWLTDDEIRLARKRMEENHSNLSKVTNKSFLDLKTWKRILTSWHVYLFSVANIFFFNVNNTSSGSFSLWLKSLDRYSTGKLNNLSTLPPALGIIWIFISCWGADFTRKRFFMMVFANTLNFIANVVLAVWDVSEKAKWFGFCMSYWSWAPSSILYPLIHDMLRHEVNQRNIEWMIIYVMGLQSSAWISRLIFPTVDSPSFPKGFSTCAAFSMAFSFTLALAYVLYKRDEKKRAMEYGIYVYNSAKGETIPPELEKSHRESIESTQIAGLDSSKEASLKE